MGRHTVNVPEYALGRKRYTAGQFLAEFAEMDGGRSKVRDLPRPVTAQWADALENQFLETFRSSSALFAFFQHLHVCRGVIFRLAWKGCKVGPVGLYELNKAIRESAVRKGGINIVRHWLETRRGCMTPLGADLAALFDFLEIRPLFTRETLASKAASLASKTLAPLALAVPLYIMSNQGEDITRKKLRSGKRRSRAKAKV